MAGSLQGVLASIPGLGGFLAGQEQDRAAQMGQLQQMGALQGILAKVQAAQKAQKYESEMAAARTPEERVAVAERHSGAAGVLSHADRLSGQAATKEAAMARLTQAAQQFESNYQLRAKAAKTPQERLELDRQKAAFTQGLQREAQRLAGAQANYNFGFQPGPATAPTVTAPMAASGASALFPGAFTGTPAERAAAAQLRPLAQGGGSMEVMPQGGAPMPVSAPVAAPAAIPEAAPAPSYPASPNNLDARDLGAMARGPVMGSTPVAGPVAPAVAAPAAPVMPQFAGSPREQAAAKNKWLLAQSKGGEAGGKATETVVDAILQGRMQMPTGFALRSPYWQDVIERVNVKDPKFDASRYGARAAARRTFASGPEARNVTALNTVIGHLGTLDEAAQALNNQDVRGFNAVANRLATELGDPRVQNFDTAKQAVAEETMRVFRQVGASEMEARMWGERIQSSGSPGQLRGVIGTLGKLLESRVEAIGQQYERTVNSPDNPARVDPANKARLDKLIKQGDTPVWDNTKEQRYQELLRKRGGS